MIWQVMFGEWCYNWHLPYEGNSQVFTDNYLEKRKEEDLFYVIQIIAMDSGFLQGQQLLPKVHCFMLDSDV